MVILIANNMNCGPEPDTKNELVVRFKFKKPGPADYIFLNGVYKTNFAGNPKIDGHGTTKFFAFGRNRDAITRINNKMIENNFIQIPENNILKDISTNNCSIGVKTIQYFLECTNENIYLFGFTGEVDEVHQDSDNDFFKKYCDDPRIVRLSAVQ
jgi:hypothetical protein